MSEESIPAAFSASVVAHADLLAVVGRDRRATYRDLAVGVDRIRSWLVHESGRRPEPVVVMMPQGLTAITAILGVLSAGKYYVPIDPGAAPAWVRRVLDEVTPRLIVTDTAHEQLARSVAPSGTWVHVLDRGLQTSSAPLFEAAVVTAESATTAQAKERVGPPVSERLERVRSTVRGDSLACVLFEQGRSGVPRGVVDNHRNALQNAMRYISATSLSPGDRLTLMEPIASGASVSTILSALLAGASVFPLDRRSETIESLADWIRDSEITIYRSTPSLFRKVVATGASFPSVRAVMLEGDGGSLKDVVRFRRHFDGQATLWNALATPETGIVSQFRAHAGTSVAGDVLPVGRACPGMSVQIIGEDGQPVPDGVDGEIAVTSRHLAVGYWNRPGMTSRCFSEAQGPEGTRTYLTGERGRIRMDGMLEHLGRMEDRIQIGGNPVIPALVEEAIALIDGVREAAVVACAPGAFDASVQHTDSGTLPQATDAQVPHSPRGRGEMSAGDGAMIDIVEIESPAVSSGDGRGDGPVPVLDFGMSEAGPRRLVAYVATDAEFRPDVSKLRAALTEKLPPHAIPVRFEFVPDIPLNDRGEVDRDALPVPGVSRPDLATPYVEPVTNLQRRLAAIWSALLAVERVGACDDFFEMGGDPALALSMLDLVEQRLGHRLAPDTLLWASTVERIAAELEGAISAEKGLVIPLQDAGDASPIFFFHGDPYAGGYYAIDLARRFGRDRPFYGVRPLGQDDGQIPRTYTAMAERYANEIKSVQPEGPYCIGGFAGGGLAALETARLIRGHGDEVETLVLLDASVSNLRFENLWKKLQILRFIGFGEGARDWIFSRVRALMLIRERTGLRGAVTAILRRLWHILKVAVMVDAGPQEIQDRVSGLKGKGLRDYKGSSSAGRRRAADLSAYERVDQRYFPAPYEGRTILVRPIEKTAAWPETESLWRRVCPQLSVTEVPGDSATFRTQFVGDLAVTMRRCIDDAVSSPAVT